MMNSKIDKSPIKKVNEITYIVKCKSGNSQETVQGKFNDRNLSLTDTEIK